MDWMILRADTQFFLQRTKRETKETKYNIWLSRYQNHRVPDLHRTHLHHPPYQSVDRNGDIFHGLPILNVGC